MIYCTNRARETARENIARLIPVVATIPGNVLSYGDAHEIIGYLQRLDEALRWEIYENTERKKREV